MPRPASLDTPHPTARPAGHPTPPPCQCCGRNVAMRRMVNRQHGGGKARVAHKCPHGHWCVAGHRLLGLHANRPLPSALGGCPECNQEEIDHRKTEGAAFDEAHRILVEE